MSSSKITVIRNGSPVRNAKVTLEFSGFSNLGFTQAVYTNSDGVAYIEHSSSGTANIYIDGTRKGSVRAPGQETVYM